MYKTPVPQIKKNKKIVLLKKRVFYLCNFRDTLFEQKSSVHMALACAGGDKQTNIQTHGKCNLQNRPRG